MLRIRLVVKEPKLLIDSELPIGHYKVPKKTKSETIPTKETEHTIKPPKQQKVKEDYNMRAFRLSIADRNRQALNDSLEEMPISQYVRTKDYLEGFSHEEVEEMLKDENFLEKLWDKVTR